MLDAIVTGATGGAGVPNVVLCHGFAADAEDLEPLAGKLGFPGPLRWLFPRAPFRFPTAWGGGRAWFPRDVASAESVLSGGFFAALSDADPPGLSQASRELLEFAGARGCRLEDTVLGGFSQGAMVAADAALRADHTPAGLLLFSGGIIAARRLRSAAAARVGSMANFRVVAYHGTEDPVLPFESGRALADVFREAGADVSLLPFEGGHGIPDFVLRAASDELVKMLSNH